jgi:streptogramin lyase
MKRNLDLKVQCSFLISIVFFILYSSSSYMLVFSQTLTNANNPNQPYVIYMKQSSFIHEFDVPAIHDRGLKGITTDNKDNAWFYYTTNKTSMIIRYSMEDSKFTPFLIKGKTTTDNAVINLAGGQVLFDNKRNVIWFTDARVNSLGKLDINSSAIELYKLPTNNSGIMGITLSPDGESIWFTEIIGNRIGSFDIQSNKIIEYPTGDSTGPTLLTFDEKGVLWVTLSYSGSILRVEPWMLIPESKANGMSTISLEKPDMFSPFGISITQKKDGTEHIFISDHGSSRVVSWEVGNELELKNYTSYWSSPSKAYPVSLPSQVAADKFSNIYFVQHGGNKISRIDSNTGIMTEFDIPTGPLATAVLLGVSPDGQKIWFTEWASNKIGYLDASAPVPLKLVVNNTIQHPIVLKSGQTFATEVLISRGGNTSSNAFLSPNDTEVGVVGMTDAGLSGVTYNASPQRIDLSKNQNVSTNLSLTVANEDNANPGFYTIMIRVSATDKDGLTTSLLYPQRVKLDVPPPTLKSQSPSTSNGNLSSGGESFSDQLRDILRYASLAAALIIIAYLIFRRVKNRRAKIQQDREKL